MSPLKNKLQGIVIGCVLTSALMVVVPAAARVGQEAIIVNFNNIRIVVDGQVVQTQNEPFIHNGRTYLPVGDVAGALGLDVHWEGTTNTVYLTSSGYAAVSQAAPDSTSQTSPGPTSSPQSTSQASPRPTSSPRSTPQASPRPTSSPTNNRPANPAISMDRAIEIAYADLDNRGISASFRSHSGMSFERGQWVWELEFRPTGQRGEIEYYIDVNNGSIVKFEWDR